MVGLVAAESTTLEEARTLLRDTVTKWIRDNEFRISETHFREQSPGSFMLLVIQKGLRYDDILTDSLINLELEIAHHPKLKAIRLDTMPSPNVGRAAVEAFMPAALEE